MDSCTSSATHATCSHLYTTRCVREEGEICVGLRATSVGVTARPPPYVRENGVIRDEKMGTEVTDLGCGGQVLAEPRL